MVLVVIKAKSEILEALGRARKDDGDLAAWLELEEHLVGLPGDWIAVVRTPAYADGRSDEERVERMPPLIRYLSLDDLAASTGFLHDANAGIAPSH